jgi:uncharacterized membrane protein HdeD (DUF308 family)
MNGGALAREGTMKSLSRETARFSTSLLACGSLMCPLGIAAIGWPDTALITAMLTAAALLALFGGYEMFIALRTRSATPGWMIPMANGAACIAFAILTLALPGLSLNVMLLLVAIWLTLYATLSAILALLLWPMTRTRYALIGWTAMNLLIALLAVTVPSANSFTLLYAGAGYAVVFGAMQVASGVWVRRIAVPHVMPTVQSGWLPAVPA